jgi:hypothetical protein
MVSLFYLLGSKYFLIYRLGTPFTIRWAKYSVQTERNLEKSLDKNVLPERT